MVSSFDKGESEGMALPHDVAVKSVGVSIQITHVKLRNVVAGSSSFCCAFTASTRCFCSTSCMIGLSSERSISSIFASGDSPLTGAAVPSARFILLEEGPGLAMRRFESRWGAVTPILGDSSLVKSTYPLGRRELRVGGAMARGSPQ